MTPKTILVVDDEPHIRYMLEFKLTGAGFKVATADNGIAAFELARSDQPDLVITDFQMPGASGLVLSMQLKSDATTSHIPVLMLTGRGHRVHASELLQTNIRQLMPKPFSPRELLIVVGELLAETVDESAGAGADAA